jgi:hypothetical protein
MLFPLIVVLDLCTYTLRLYCSFDVVEMLLVGLITLKVIYDMYIYQNNIEVQTNSATLSNRQATPGLGLVITASQ